MKRVSRHMDRRALFASGAAAALLAATGGAAGSSPSRGGRLRLALSGATRTDGFDARQPQGLFMQVAMAGLVFDTLTEVGADGTLRGELATGWQGDASARTWLFDLRPDVQFHNGSGFSAQDVVTSFDLHRGGMLRDVTNIEVVDRMRLRIDLGTADPDFPYRLSTPQLVIYPAGQMARAMVEGIGTGLYRLHQFVPGRQVIGLRVAQHYKDGIAGWFDSVELVSVPADHVRAEAVAEGFVDAADLSDPRLLETMRGATALPNPGDVDTVVQSDLQMHAAIGTRAPLDNLRAAERWWMG